MKGEIMSRGLPILVAAFILIALIATPSLASPATATRTLPASASSAAEFDVAIEPSGCGAFGQVVETLPDGFTCISCTPSDVGVEQAGHTIKFTFLGSADFTYRVRAPTVAAITTYTFHGIVKDEDKTEYPIQDDDITVTVSTPPCETYTLTLTVDGNGSTTPSEGSHAYDAGTVLDIGATPASDWRFDRWSSNVADRSSSSTTVTIDSDKTVTAYFTQIPAAMHTLTVACEPSEGGRVVLDPAAEGNRYEEGTMVGLTAIPNDGYAFSSWNGDLAGSNNPNTVTVDSDKNVLANFEFLETESPATFVLSPLNISPEQVEANEDVRISTNITNHGGQIGTYDAVLYINGQVEDRHLVSVSPGSAQTVVFSISKATPGTYSVSLGGEQGRFTIVASQSGSRALDTGIMIAIVVIMALIAALVLLFRRTKKRT
ncbi:hypothetical protein ES703_62917 [subsurface metagenome]